MAEPQQLTDQEQGQLELLYQNVTANLEARKKQQWQVLVFYSAVTAFLISQSREMSETAKCIAAIAIIAGAISTWIMILLYQNGMSEARKELCRVYSHFSEKFEKFKCTKESASKPKSNCFEIFFCLGSGFYLAAVAVLSIVIFLGEGKIRTLLAYLCRLVGLQ